MIREITTCLYIYCIYTLKQRSKQSYFGLDRSIYPVVRSAGFAVVFTCFKWRTTWPVAISACITVTSVSACDISTETLSGISGVALKSQRLRRTTSRYVFTMFLKEICFRSVFSSSRKGAWLSDREYCSRSWRQEKPKPWPWSTRDVAEKFVYCIRRDEMRRSNFAKYGIFKFSCF